MSAVPHFSLPPLQWQAKLKAAGVLPMLRLSPNDVAPELGHALHLAGVTAVEILADSVGLPAIIRALKASGSGLLVGVGGAIDHQDLAAASEAGANFITSPGTTRDLLEAARSSGVPFIPGVQTLSESISALQAGFTVQRLFPADTISAVAWLKHAERVLPAVQYIPLGGITSRTANEFALPNVLAIAGAWMAPESFLHAKNWMGIAQLAREAMAARPRF